MLLRAARRSADPGRGRGHGPRRGPADDHAGAARTAADRGSSNGRRCTTRASNSSSTPTCPRRADPYLRRSPARRRPAVPRRARHGGDGPGRGRPDRPAGHADAGGRGVPAADRRPGRAAPPPSASRCWPRTPRPCDVVIRSSETGFQADHFRATLRYRRAASPRHQRRRTSAADPAPCGCRWTRPLSCTARVLFQGGRFRRLLGLPAAGRQRHAWRRSRTRAGDRLVRRLPARRT